MEGPVRALVVSAVREVAWAYFRKSGGQTHAVVKEIVTLLLRAGDRPGVRVSES